MSTRRISLDSITIASPCGASWEDMSGDDRVRFCGRCAQFVYNLSELTMKEAQDLVQENEGEVCVRFHRRADGTMLTRDCAVGANAPRWFGAAGTRAAALFLAFVGLMTLGLLFTSQTTMGKPCKEPRQAVPAPQK